MKQKEQFTQVAFIALRNKDDSLLTDVPLYVKVSEITTNDVSTEQEQLLHKISAVMIRRYEKQISEYFANQKKE